MFIKGFKEQEDSLNVIKNSSYNQFTNGNFGIFFDIQKNFQIDGTIKTDLPEMFSSVSQDWDKGTYTWGVASTEKIDSDGETVVIPEDVLKKLTEKPYNKVFHSHQHSDIASGMIVFAGKINGTPIIVEKMNEDHPSFQNYLGSIKNGFIDSYSIGGNAREKTVNGKKVREVYELKEVSRTSLPANPEALIGGMFTLKTLKSGSYIYKQEKTEDNNMTESEINARIDILTKGMEDMSTKFGEAMKNMQIMMETMNKAQAGAQALPLNDTKNAEIESLKKQVEELSKTLKLPIGRQSEITDNRNESIMKGYNELRFDMYKNMFKDGFQGSVI